MGFNRIRWGQLGQLGQVRSREVKSGQVGSSEVRLDLVRSYEVRSDMVRIFGWVEAY